jgi:hypothetical protein
MPEGLDFVDTKTRLVAYAQLQESTQRNVRKT